MNGEPGRPSTNVTSCGLPFEFSLDSLNAVCRRFGILRLSVFGSALRDKRGAQLGRQAPALHASAYRQLRLQGTPIPMNDVWIAALVLQHNLRLHARDRHFDHLPQIVRA